MYKETYKKTYRGDIQKGNTWRDADKGRVKGYTKRTRRGSA